MKFNVVIGLKKDLDMRKVRELDKAEALGVWNLHKREVLSQMYHRADGPGAVAIMESADENTLREELKTLPRYEMMEFQIVPLRAYDSFEMLWAEPPTAW